MIILGEAARDTALRVFQTPTCGVVGAQHKEALQKWRSEGVQAQTEWT